MRSWFVATALVVSVFVVPVFAGSAYAAEHCPPWNNEGKSIWDCGAAEGLVWLAASPVWAPIGFVKVILFGHSPTPQEIALNRAILQAWDTASPEKRQELIQLLQLRQAVQAADADRQLRTLELFNQTVNGMYQPQPRPPQITTCNPFGRGIICNTQ